MPKASPSQALAVLTVRPAKTQQYRAIARWLRKQADLMDQTLHAGTIDKPLVSRYFAATQKKDPLL